MLLKEECGASPQQTNMKHKVLQQQNAPKGRARCKSANNKK